MKKLLLAAVIFLGTVSVASAHVVVKPSQVGVGSFQTFTTGVPVEKSIPTTGLRLIIPAGLQYVSPNVKPGWKITVKKNGTSSDATVTEINWVGGSIPAGQRDDFVFSAKVPSTEAKLQWKAYQTYADGSVVAWTEDPTQQTGGEEGTPYSETKVVNDLAPSASTYSTVEINSLAISIGSLAISLAALIIAKKNRLKNNEQTP